MQKSSFVDFKYLKGRPCSFPFVYEGLVGSLSGNMSRKDNLILLAQSFYLIPMIDDNDNVNLTLDKGKGAINANVT